MGGDGDSTLRMIIPEIKFRSYFGIKTFMLVITQL